MAGGRLGLWGSRDSSICEHMAGSSIITFHHSHMVMRVTPKRKTNSGLFSLADIALVKGQGAGLPFGTQICRWCSIPGLVHNRAPLCWKFHTSHKPDSQQYPQGQALRPWSWEEGTFGRRLRSRSLQCNRTAKSAWPKRGSSGDRPGC